MNREICRRLPLDPSLLCLAPEEVAFFQECTGIQSEEKLFAHIQGIAVAAYDLFPYPCIRWYTFTKLEMSYHPAYAYALSFKSLKENILVDIGSCFGTDLRKLVRDGYPSDRIIGFDVRSSFWGLGHHLFKSTPSTFPVKFVEGSVFDLETYDDNRSDQPPEEWAVPETLSNLAPVMGRASVVYAGYFFHLFSKEDQRRVAILLSRLLFQRPGAIIFGRHKGLPEEGIDNTVPSGRAMFCHSPQSWKALWTSILGERARVEAELSTKPHARGGDMVFTNGNGHGVESGEMNRSPRGHEWLTWSVTVL